MLESDNASVPVITKNQVTLAHWLYVIGVEYLEMLKWSLIAM